MSFSVITQLRKINGSARQFTIRSQMPHSMFRTGVNRAALIKTLYLNSTVTVKTMSDLCFVISSKTHDTAKLITVTYANLSYAYKLLYLL